MYLLQHQHYCQEILILKNMAVKTEFVACVSHNHALYHDDNAKLYYYLKEATHGTSYAVLSKPFQCTRRGALNVLTSQYAGCDKWS